MKLVVIVECLYICLFQNALLYHFKNVADMSLFVSSSVELDYAIFVTVFCPEQFFACNEYSINTWERTQLGSNDTELRSLNKEKHPEEWIPTGYRPDPGSDLVQFSCKFCQVREDLCWPGNYSTNRFWLCVMSSVPLETLAIEERMRWRRSLHWARLQFSGGGRQETSSHEEVVGSEKSCGKKKQLKAIEERALGEMLYAAGHGAWGKPCEDQKEEDSRRESRVQKAQR